MEQNSTFENRLAHERSPYLLQHKNNPVDWYPWGEEAFEKAKADNKLIFLSVGYSTCHWCHVMAHESFEDPQVAQVMNELFVNIKVDREERPDVDKIYMTFVQMVTGGGGWPMSVWLTPDLKPVMGGTYYPPQDSYGRPGFVTLCKFLQKKWETQGDKMLESAETVYNAMKEAVEQETSAKLEFNDGPIKTCYRMLTRTFDSKYGGFSRAPKFPRPVIFNFLFQILAQHKDEEALNMIKLTLKNMGDGGMYDHLDGGFHRYSVTADWHIPHFEKMLYDQGQIVNAYLDAFLVTRDVYYQKKARETLDYIMKCLTSPEGGFYSAEDADSIIEYGKPEHAEGAFYVWTFDEIQSALGENAPIFNYYFGVLPDGNVPPSGDPHGELKHKNHLKVTHTMEEAANKFSKSVDQAESIISQCKKQLNAIREKRPRPHLDDKIITAWNGLTISAFARAYQVLEDPKYLAAAQRAAQFIKEKLYKDGVLIRNYRNGPSNIRAFADDYAFLIHGLLDLYEANFEIEWLQWATQLQETQNALFWDSKNGGYFGVEEGDKNLMLRMKEDYDGAEPCNNSMSALNLLRLSQMCGNEKYREYAENIFHFFMRQLTESPIVVPQMCVALSYYLTKPMQIVFAGKKEDIRTLVSETNKHFIPNKVMLLADGSTGQQWLSDRLEFIKGITTDKPSAFVCENYTCQLPISSTIELSRMLDTRK